MQPSTPQSVLAPIQGSYPGRERAFPRAHVEHLIDASLARQFLAYLEYVDLNPDQLGFKEVGALIGAIPRSSLVSTRVIIEMLERTAKVTGRSDVGLKFGEWLDRRDLGPLFLMADHTRSFAQHYRLYKKYIQTLTNSLHYSEVREGNSVALVLALNSVQQHGAAQFQEGHVAVIVRVGRAILGESWAPVSVEFSHSQSNSTRIQRRFFRCPVLYDCARDAIVLSSDDYVRDIARGDEKTLTFIENYLANQITKWPADLCEQVERIVAAQLPGGGASIKRIAGLLAMSPSSLQHKLAASGSSFAEILASVRVNVVRSHLAQRSSGPSLALLAHRLGFSEPSVACRFVRKHFGTSAKSLLENQSSDY